MKISERTLLLVSTAAFLLAAVGIFQLPQKDPPVVIDTTGQITTGDPNAPVHIIVFEEFACPHCQRFHTEDAPVIYEKYVRTGKAKLTTIPMALLEPSSIPFATSTCASDQGRKHNKEFLDYLFSLPQEKLLSSSARELLSSYASQHIDFRLSDALDCVNSNLPELKFEKNRSLVTGDTIEMPMIIINGHNLKKISLNDICNRIEHELHAKI